MTDKQDGLDGFDTLGFQAMNTAFYFAVSDCQAANWKEVVYNWVKYVEKEWSRFQLHNELYLLNQLSIGGQLTLSPPLFDVLMHADEYRRKSNNLFSPYLLPLMQYHGYDQSFPFTLVKQEARVQPDVFNRLHSPFKFDMQTFTVTRISEGQADLGGIAKGYTIQAAARWLQKYGHTSSGMADGGGDMTVWSNGDKTWNIGIADPLNNDREIGQFSLKNGSIATSNIVYRSWMQGNERKHHLLNGRTGLPVESGIIQATVIAENCLNAEAAAKLCFMETEPALTPLLKRIASNIQYLLVSTNGNLMEGRISEE